MHYNTLLTAALCTTRLLRSYNLHHAFFGGFATTSLGCRRETKDLDILVQTSKTTLTRLLNGRKDWLEVQQGRDDYVAYLWKGCGEANMVLVEFFFFRAGKDGMQQARFPQIQSFTHFKTSATLPLLSPWHLFLGKLSATAGREKETDLADLLFLVSRYPAEIERGLRSARLGSRSAVALGKMFTAKSSSAGLDRRGRSEIQQMLAAAGRKWPELRMALVRVGVKGTRSGVHATACAPRAPRLECGAVQRGLVC
ncbi:hypothetical protein FGG08_003069 [Glutinoglossum americanum]|uniref:Uncharacterized protein n=1 Tax=Glutinoglossum americanum TaxID=1670608 RepID=A0A9P8IE20_9PEZI|nr:hypothetical protein FGG08_003069 [Glutinoglossum americanum]